MKKEIKKIMKFLNKNFKVILLNITILAGIIIISSAFINRNEAHEIISVTGLGKKDFTSDFIVWSGSFTRVDMSLKNAYKLLKNDEKLITRFLKKNKIESTEIIISATKINKKYNSVYDKNNNFSKIFAGYSLSKVIKIESKDVNKIERFSRNITEIINTGIEFYSYEPQYYYTKLAELKIKMIAEATADARKRAETIADRSKSSLGKLKYSRMGVFQIIGQNSNENFSSSGAYNTSSKNKTAVITMKLQYQID